MAEYIARDKLWDTFVDEPFYDNADKDEIVLPIIDSFPAADVAPVVHGKWINTSEMYGVYSGRCSVCGLASGMWHINQPYKYCPYCGAKMDKEEK